MEVTFFADVEVMHNVLITPSTCIRTPLNGLFQDSLKDHAQMHHFQYNFTKRDISQSPTLLTEDRTNIFAARGPPLALDSRAKIDFLNNYIIEWPIYETLQMLTPYTLNHTQDDSLCVIRQTHKHTSALLAPNHS